MEKRNQNLPIEIVAVHKKAFRYKILYTQKTLKREYHPDFGINWERLLHKEDAEPFVQDLSTQISVINLKQISCWLTAQPEGRWRDTQGRRKRREGRRYADERALVITSSRYPCGINLGQSIIPASSLLCTNRIAQITLSIVGKPTPACRTECGLIQGHQ